MIATRLIVLFVLACSISAAAAVETQPVALRIATFNIEDVRSDDLNDSSNERLRDIAAVIQRLRPNIILLNEIAVNDDDGPTNAEKFVYNYLATSQGEGLQPIRFDTYIPETNTGVHSGFDLDNSGTMDPEVPEPSEDGQTPEQRAYGNDCFGFGTFPGQYGMALLVHPKLKIQTDEIRTLQHFLWKDLPGHSAPMNEDGTPWYSDEEWEAMPLPSKTFADVPITLPNGTVLHALISHPTPPAFDGPERRNVLRNHDEIALIRAYIDNAPELYDDAGTAGGLEPEANFVILGDLNCDPADGSGVEMTMFSQLFSSERVASDAHPASTIRVDDLDRTDTARFGLRVDYVLPSAGITITETGVWRDAGDAERFPSDHFPVWAEVIVP
ncbi:MAG: endonuclease/exonuclease/phosphatase family protein [Phycisphaerales bacterium JB052]